MPPQLHPIRKAFLIAYLDRALDGVSRYRNRTITRYREFETSLKFTFDESRVELDPSTTREEALVRYEKYRDHLVTRFNILGLK